MSDKKLNHDEWYDILAISYVRAVAKYQPHKSSFSTFAYFCMENTRKIKYRERNTRNRLANNDLVSLNQLIKDKDSELIETMTDGYDFQEDCIFTDAFNLFLNQLSGKERKILKLRAMGYTLREIGKIFSLSHEKIRVIIVDCKKIYYETLKT